MIKGPSKNFLQYAFVDLLKAQVQKQTAVSKLVWDQVCQPLTIQVFDLILLQVDAALYLPQHNRVIHFDS